MKGSFASFAAIAAVTSLASASHIFLTPISATSSTGGSDLWPASNLIQGPGAGFDATDPHLKIPSGPGSDWVTADPGGFPSDYIAVAGTPVITLDLGSDVTLDQIHTWGYADSNTNGVSDFSLRFATEIDGTGAFGTSISYNPSFSISQDEFAMQTNTFSESVTARYVEFTALDNFFVAPGDVDPRGGDRVGLGEISFSAIPEPATGLLGLLGLGLALRRRR